MNPIHITKCFIALTLCFLSFYSFSQNGENIQKIKTHKISQGIKAGGHIAYHNFDVKIDSLSFDHDRESIMYGKNIFPYLYAITDEGDTLSANEKYYQPGIIDNDGEIVQGSEEFFNKVWKINHYDLQRLKVLFTNDELSLLDIPSDILTWPAFGNPYIEDQFAQFQYAAFNDLNNDGIYNPLDGDLPRMKDIDVQPHEFLLSIFHDKAENPGRTAINFQFIVHQYVVNCEIGNLASSIFTDLEIINKGNLTYTDVKLGLSVFPSYDVCDYNSYFGTDTTNNSIYFYPVPANENMCITPQTIISKEYSLCNVFQFDHTLSSAAYRTDNFTMAYPNTKEIFNMLSGNQVSGIPFNLGGNGIDSATTETTKFLFTSFPNEIDGWSQHQEQFQPEYLIAIPTFTLGTLAPNESKNFAYSETALSKKDTTKLSIFDDYPSLVNQFNLEHQKFLNGDSECMQSEYCTSECLWPGDANLNGKVEINDILYILKNSDTPNGVTRNEIDLNWFPHTSPDWEITFNGIDIKHSDVNGNGEINLADIRHLKRNLALNNKDYLPTSIDTPFLDPKGLYFDIDTIFTTDQSLVGNVGIGNEFEQISDSMLGITYKMVWDTSFLEYFTHIPLDLFTHNLHTLNGSPIDTFHPQIRKNVFETEIGIYEKNPIISGGELVHFRFFKREDASTMNPDGIDTTYIDFYNIMAVNQEGFVSLGVRYSQPIIFYDLPIDTTSITSDESELSDNLSIFPNPASDYLFVQAENVPENIEYQILSLEGTIYSKGTLYLNQPIDISQLPSGVYILRTVLNNKIEISKFMKL